MLEPGHRIDPYEVQALLGEGGMAVVYECVDHRTGQSVALKLLKPEYASRERAVKRFTEEARTMGSLDHPNIAHVIDVGRSASRTWMAMELLPQGSLADALNHDGPMLPVRAAALLSDVLGALAAAHEQGVIHRDVKPDNVLIAQDGTAKLTDFGIARVDDRSHSLTRTGTMLGTWAYMAPEQRIDAKKVDARADLYSCGAMLYALLTARPPMDLTTQEVREEIGHGGIPDGLAAVIRRSTRYRPSDRYASAHAMREHLHEVSRNLPATRLGTKADPPTLHDTNVTFDLDPTEPEPNDPLDPERPSSEHHEPRRLRAVLLVAAIGVVVLGWLGAYLTSGDDSAETETSRYPVSVDTVPSGTVLVDGVFKGTTPWHSTPLGPGARLTVKLTDGRSQTWSIDDEGGLQLCWDFEQGAPCTTH